MSKTDVSRYTKKIHKAMLASPSGRYQRMKAAVAGQQSYFTGKPCKYGHIDWRNTSTGHCKTCIREYFKKNPKAHYEKTAGWVKKNPGKRKDIVSRYDAKHRGEKRGAKAVFQYREIGGLLRRQKNRCANCKRDISSRYHADHIVPLCRGGSNDIKNIQLLCPPCNLKKGAKDPLVWAQENGRLL